MATFFDGAASAPLPVFVEDRPGAAWFDRGKARIVFDFHVEGGLVQKIEFRGDPDVPPRVRRRRGGTRR